MQVRDLEGLLGNETTSYEYTSMRTEHILLLLGTDVGVVLEPGFIFMVLGESEVRKDQEHWIL